ncbi:methyltransferase [Yeosuana aromativorans]|uniref:Methyltransferase n=1 Tax=Yeosuana aromativorans TaxID=288019 RepID=A0A8J3BRS0_9FLAO|nr:class I SAM-dependent methyltransferase [Yeosuana aromativorans]GGK30531.1 methyltransferase [Yeosuana aromativorans]
MNKKAFLKVKDHSVSGEEFDLLYDSEFDFLETTPQPSKEKLPEYYKSEDYISHTDSKRNLFEKVYHVVKTRTLKRKLKLINKYSKNEISLLDFGCGTGDFLKVAKESEWEVFGVEPNDQARQIANSKLDELVFTSEEFLKFEKERFDVITLWHVLEHVPDLNTHLALFKKLLKPNGTLIIAVPNYKSFDAKIYKRYWAAFDVPRHLWHFSRTSINKLMMLNQMEVVKTYPMLFDAFYVSLLSEKYKTGHMNPIRAFCVGCLSNLKAIRSKEYSSLIYVVKNSKN